MTCAFTFGSRIVTILQTTVGRKPINAAFVASIVIPMGQMYSSLVPRGDTKQSNSSPHSPKLFNIAFPRHNKQPSKHKNNATGIHIVFIAWKR